MKPDLKSEFLAGLQAHEIGLMLPEYLPDLTFFAKDRNGRFVLANPSFLEKMRMRSESELIGLTDFDLFPPHQAEVYQRDDQAVMGSGRPQLNKLELIPAPDGSLDWYHTTKVPLHSKDGVVVGIAGITRDLRRISSSMRTHLVMEPVIKHMLEHYSGEVSMDKLARLAKLTRTRFARRFKQQFQASPMQYLTNVRVNAACRLLASTYQSISHIALQTGFYDHSYFTKQFQKSKGMTPNQYRKAFFENPGGRRRPRLEDRAA